MICDVAAKGAGSVEHVSTHSSGGGVAISLRHSCQVATMLEPRGHDAGALPQLSASNGVQACAYREGLLRQKAIVGPAIERLVEYLIEHLPELHETLTRKSEP